MGKNGNREYSEKISLKNTVFKGTSGVKKTEETEKRIINTESIEYFKMVLIRNEKSIQTIEKYIRDIKKLMIYAHGQSISKEMLLEYKEYLEKCGRYKISSINSYLAAANHFCEVICY